MNGQQRTFLKVFIEVAASPSSSKTNNEELKSNEASSGSSLSTPTLSSSKPKSGSFGYNALNRQGSVNRVKSDPISSAASSTTAQYTIVPISSSSKASDVCNLVARKRNLLYTGDEYELVMCDGDGQASYETILSPHDMPHQFQQSAAKHGHLGDFHFVFRKVNEDLETDIEDDTDAESEPDIFGTMPQQIKHGKYPAAWMEKRGKTHKAWRRRYFVLIENELLYYKRRDVYESNKEPIARIELVNPPGIIKILPPETIRKNNSTTTTFFYFDIHTPKRVYSLRIDNYNDMIFWVKALSRRNEPNELIDGIDSLISQSEQLHSNDDEDIMEKFSTLQSILEDKDATDAYMKYLQSIHNEEFIHFWLDLKQYLSGYDNSSKDTQKRFANELYEKYIKSGAKYQLSEIKSKHRSNLRKLIQSGQIDKNMFDEIKNSVFDYLNRDSYKFFDSSEYFRFIVTYKHIDNQNKFSWPEQFEDEIERKNQEKHKYILSSNQNLIHSHSKHGKSIINMHNAHSPVLRQRPQSPVHTYQHHTKTLKLKGGDDYNNNNGFQAKSWTKDNAFNPASSSSKTDINNKRRSRRSHGKSIFDNAPGVASSVK